ncbi:MAG: hypothetical protein J5I99_08255 [Verrucomicrobia bacterium]|nr:hypothetical protein [Verrucomicrobiota bacterium]
MSGKSFLVGLAISMLAWSSASLARAQDVKLTPGVPAEFDVPNAPPSMAIQLRHASDAVRMTIKLPADYDLNKSYPVLVFLNGGDGGMGGELNMAEPFLGGEGYILCNMPLFKRVVETDRDEVKWSITPADGPYALAAYRILFGELSRLVPNLDPSRSVLAGFSSGASGVALLLWIGERELLDVFSAFVMVEGGFWLGRTEDRESGIAFQRGNFSGLDGKRVLILYGDQTMPEDRIPWIADAKETGAALQAAGVNAEALPMNGIGHEFPADVMEKTRAWLTRGW